MKKVLSFIIDLVINLVVDIIFLLIFSFVISFSTGVVLNEKIPTTHIALIILSVALFIRAIINLVGGIEKYD